MTVGIAVLAGDVTRDGPLEQAGLSLLAAGAVQLPAVRVGRLIPGALLDGVALADAGWQVVTVSRGTLGTVARIHTPRDSLDHLRGEGMAITASIIVGAIATSA